MWGDVGRWQRLHDEDALEGRHLVRVRVRVRVRVSVRVRVRVKAREGRHRGRQAVRPLRLGPVRGGPLRPLRAVQVERLRGDAGRCGEKRGDVGRCGEMWGDAGRCGEVWGDAGRYGEVRGAAACAVAGSAATSEARAGARSGLAHGGRLAAAAPPPSTREVPESSSHSCSPKRCGLSRWTRCTAYVSRSRLKSDRETLPKTSRVSS